MANIVGGIARAAGDWAKFGKSWLEEPQYGKPIFITGAQRSGTTWVGQMLHTEGTRLYHEPLGRYGVLWNPNAHYNEPQGSDLKGLQAKLKEILEGDEWKSFTWPHWNPAKRGTSRLSPIRLLGMKRGRVLIKDPTALAMLEHITAWYDMRFVVLFRHPCGYASSLQQQNWAPNMRVRTLFEHPAFAKYGFDRYLSLYKRFEALSPLQRYTLQLGLLDTILCRFVAAHPERCSVFLYEDLAADPEARFKGIFEQLGLAYTDAVRHSHTMLTREATEVSRDDVHRHAVKRDSRTYSDIWRERLTDDDAARIRSVWAEFDLDLYRDDAHWER